LTRFALRRGFVAGIAAAVALCLALGAAGHAVAAEKKNFKIAWSIYVGWMPWPYAQESGILKKWADKYGIAIELVQINDYVESINQYTAGAFDGVVVTNMDCLTIPAAGGVDSSSIILGDYSNGNDAVILKSVGIAPTKKALADIAGQKVNLVQLSVSQYLLSRALGTVNLKESDVTLVNTSDADIVGAFGTSDVTALVTWNPQVSEILKNRNAQKVFDSAQIPGEIMDMMVVNTQTLKDNPKLAMALVGAWYEVLGIMRGNDEAATAARTQMAKDSGTDLEGFNGQLKTTRMYYDPAEATAWARSKDIVKTMDLVRKFSFDHGLLGEGAKTVDKVGILFPGGETLGDPQNIKMRFNADFMKMAADHKL
jgi:NitT/TauT family transport system substrate-binding protein